MTEAIKPTTRAATALNAEQASNHTTQ
jgi:hypothetical protein